MAKTGILLTTVAAIPQQSVRHAGRIAIPPTMIKLGEGQRAVLVQAFPAVAHVGVGGLVFGQFLRDRPFSIRLALGGIAVWFVFVGAAVFLARRNR